MIGKSVTSTGALMAGALGVGLLLGLGIRSAFHEGPSTPMEHGSMTGSAPGDPSAHAQHSGMSPAPVADPPMKGMKHGPGSTRGATEEPMRSPPADMEGMAPDTHQEERDDREETGSGISEGELLVDLGNEKCPVLGGAPDGKSYSVWNHLRIGH